MVGEKITDRTHETIINGVLAQVLRERVGLSAVAETLREKARPDIIVRLTESVIVLETEVAPALTVEAASGWSRTLPGSSLPVHDGHGSESGQPIFACSGVDPA